MIKRLIDIIISLILLILLLPLCILIFFLVKIKIGSPVFFKQLRTGKNGRVFTIFKFRTMIDKRDKNSILLHDKVRLTKTGERLRSISVDELPSLWNVIKGDMSLVGPRPLLIEYLPLYSDEQFKRHIVKPGITGWAQVNGRNAIDWGEKFDLDVWYVNNQSIWLDLKILWLTVNKVIMRDGISQNNHVTMDKFKGNL
jgi:sugar transferase EpsL